MILLHKHSIESTIRDRYACSVYSFDFENINQNGSNELKFEITIDTEAFISKFEANIDGEKFIGNTKPKETASKEYSEAKEKNENAILISKPYDDIPNVFEIKTNIDSKSKISLAITIEQYIQKKFNANQLNIQILRNFTKYNIIQNFEYISFQVHITDRSGIYDVNIPLPLQGMRMEHQSMDKRSQQYVAKGIIMKHTSINELVIQYKVKGEQNESMLLYDAKSHTFCHIISDIISDSVMKNEQDTEEGNPDKMNENLLIPRRVVFVIDKSGSMAGGKWTRAISATVTAIKQLRKGYDRYCILFFSRDVTCVPTSTIVLATESNITKTISILQSIYASGGTNINTPLLQAIEWIKKDIKLCCDKGDNFYMNQILLITDGEPNSGERDPHKIISNVKDANHLKDIDPYMSKISIFSFGVGTDSNDSSWIKDLNHSFLKLLSLNNNGFYQRIKSSHTDTALTQYFDILSKPVLFNIDIQYNHKNIQQLSTTTFHTLYAGHDIIICGKLEAADTNQKELCLDLSITATTAKAVRTADDDRCITKPVDICKEMRVSIEVKPSEATQEGYNHIERIWAYLKLQEFAKKKLIYNDLIEVSEDEKRDDDALPLSLAMKYKFVTPWTSMIVVKKKEEIAIPKAQGFMKRMGGQAGCMHRMHSKAANQTHFCDYTFKPPAPPSGVSKETLEKVQAMKKRCESTISGRVNDVNQRRLRSLRMAHKHTQHEPSKEAREKAEHLKRSIENIKGQRVKYSRDRRTRAAAIDMKLQSAEYSQDDKRQIQIQHFIDESDSFRAQRARQRVTKHKIKASDFKLVKIIGKGAFGDVRIVRHSEDDTKVFVMKTMVKKMMVAKSPLQQTAATNAIMSIADCQWVVKLHYSFQDSTYFYLVMEYCTGGDLMSVLMKCDILDEKQTKFYISELNEAIHAIHELGLVHRDLKPGNILIAESGDIKLSDVSVATHFKTENDRIIEQYEAKQASLKDEDMEQASKGHESIVATADYLAPEVFSQKGYNKMVDYWSMGAIMFECVAGYPPFHANDPLHTCRKIVHYRKYFKMPQNVKLSKECGDLIHNLVCSQRRRYSFQQIKQHPFFKKQ